ncbi:MAG: ABC transporter ATP-binding protein [Tepidisphaeraceae bacterium]
MIQLHHVIKKFGRQRAVDDVSLHIRPGESIALWGTNGAGKSTLLRCMLGLYRYRGSIVIDGIDARRHGKRARQLVGYVPQEISFYDDLRVAEALRYFGTLKGVTGIDIDAALDRVGLLGTDRKRVRELSGGMKQRLALALALQSEPRVLLLDEVTASLDIAGRGELIQLLSTLGGGETTFVFASHRVEEIELLATRVVSLEHGRVTNDQPTASFLDDHAPAVVEPVIRRCRQALLGGVSC